MSSKTIFGILAVWTGTPPTGTLPPYLYATGTGAEIRISEDTLSTGLAFTSDVLADKPIPGIAHDSDLRRGGDRAAYTGVNIEVLNTPDAGGGTAMFAALQALGISLQGCQMQIVEFTGIGSTWTETPFWWGICDDVQWSGTSLTLVCKTSRLRRNSPAFTLINNGQYPTVADLLQAVNNNEVSCNYPFANDDDDGKMVPMTLGALPYAKMLRTADMVIPTVINGGGASGLLVAVLSLATDTTQYRYVYASATDWGDIQDFAVYGPLIPGTGPINAVIYYIKIGYGGSWEKSTDSGTTWSPCTTSGSQPLTALAGKYLVATVGQQSGSGQLIASAAFNPHGDFGSYGAAGSSSAGALDADVIAITLAANQGFTDDKGNPAQLYPNNGTTPGDSDTWAEIQAAYQGYAADVWPGAGWN